MCTSQAQVLCVPEGLVCLTCSLNWQHQLCKNPRSNPDIKTLFTDHSCSPTTNGARPGPPANSPLVGPIAKAGAFPPIGSHIVSVLSLF